MHHHSGLKRRYAKEAVLVLQELADMLNKWLLSNQMEGILYLDGKQQTKIQGSTRLKVYEAGPQKNADDLIAAHVRKWSNKLEMILVTDDRDLRKRCKSQLADEMKSKDLAKELFISSAIGKTSTGSTEKEGTLLGKEGVPAREVDEMKLLFHLRDKDEKDGKL